MTVPLHFVRLLQGSIRGNSLSSWVMFVCHSSWEGYRATFRSRRRHIPFRLHSGMRWVLVWCA